MSNEPETQSGDGLDLTQTLIIPAKHRPAPAPESVPDEMRHILVEVVGGPMDGLRSRHSTAEYRIGRGPGNDLTLPADPMISTDHARIVREGRTFFLEDLGSRNGTYIGDSRITDRVPIGAGTTFRTGHTQLEFQPR